MRASRGRAAMAIVVGVAAVLATAAPTADARRPVPRPDLVVASGSVKVVAGGKLTGKFVVANHGNARAGKSTSALSVRASGKWRLVKRYNLPALKRSAIKRLTVAIALPKRLPSGTLRLRVCADSGGDVRERSETDNCRAVGSIRPPAKSPAPRPSPAPAPTPGPAPAPPAPVTPTPPHRPASSIPTAPIAFTKNTVFTHSESQGNYWIYVPNAYDSSHATPITLFIWLHGCGGYSEHEISTVSPGADQDYIAIAPDGREGGCWDVDTDPAKILAAIADVETHFNINPRRVIIGGYSSGGDLAYRTAFTNAYLFAGVLAENTSPFQDTGLQPAQAMADAQWKFNVVHLAHTGDTTYPIDNVRADTDAMATANFPVTRIERPGTHYDDDTATAGTVHDLLTLLLPHIDDGWLAPP